MMCPWGSWIRFLILILIIILMLMLNKKSSNISSIRDSGKKELIVIPLSLIDDPRVMNLKYTFHPISVYTKSSTQHLGSWNLHCFLVCIWTKIWEYFPSFLLSFTHLISIHSRISYIERYSCMHQSVITIICPIRAIYLPSEQWDGKTGVLVDLVLCAKCSFL